MLFDLESNDEILISGAVSHRFHDAACSAFLNIDDKDR